MKKILLVSLYMIFVFIASSQSAVQWQATFGGTYGEWVEDAIQSSDGGFVIIGETESADGDFLTNKGNKDIGVVRIDSAGNKSWSFCYGGIDEEEATSIIEGHNGKYYIVGSTRSNEHDVSGNHGGADAWLLCIDINGIIQWQKCYGGTNDDRFYQIIQSNTGFLIIGSTRSNDGDVSGNHGFQTWDTWLIEVDTLGTLLRQKCFGGSDAEHGKAIILLHDSIPIILSQSRSSDGDLDTNRGNYDVWLFRLNFLWAFSWKKTFGGSATENSYKLLLSTDTSIIFLGSTSSVDGDVNGNHSQYDDAWLVKLDEYGNISTSKCLGGSNDDFCQSIIQTPDNGFILTGYGGSNNGDVIHIPDLVGENWIVKIDSSFNVEWSRTFGGIYYEQGNTIILTDDGGYFSAASKYDYVPSLLSNFRDFWCLKLAHFVDVEDFEQEQLVTFNAFPNPASQRLNISINSTESQICTIRVFDITGSLVHAEKITLLNGMGTIDVSTLPSGVYILRTTVRDMVCTKKFIKK